MTQRTVMRRKEMRTNLTPIAKIHSRHQQCSHLVHGPSGDFVRGIPQRVDVLVLPWHWLEPKAPTSLLHPETDTATPSTTLWSRQLARTHNQAHT